MLLLVGSEKNKKEYLNKELLRGYCTPNQKLPCFVLYLKFINTFLQK